MYWPKTTELPAQFGGGRFKTIPATVKIVDFSVPEGHIMLGGVLYRVTHDPKELEAIRYPDGSRPTACALVPVNSRL